MLYRMISPPTLLPLTIGGIYYPGVPGTILEVDHNIADQIWPAGYKRIAAVGPTSGRPSLSDIQPFCAKPGQLFYDQTLSAWLVYDGLIWRSATTGAAV